MYYRILMIVLVGLSPGLFVGCAHTSEPEMTYQKSPSEEIQTYEMALARLKSSPFAKRTEAELALAESLLRRAETRLASGRRRDIQRLPLLLDAVQGQLVKVQAIYARFAAEKKLEADRSVYIDRASAIQDLQKSNEERLQKQKGAQ